MLVLQALAGLAIFGLQVGSCLAAQQHKELDAPKIKVAYLVNFARYVRWPEHAFRNKQSPLIIGIDASNPYAKELDNRVAGKSKDDRPIIFSVIDSASNIKGVHILYTPRDKYWEHQSELMSHSVLTVGDSINFIKNGGIIQFVEESQRIRFFIDRKQAEERGLKIHYKVLEMAKDTAEGNHS